MSKDTGPRFEAKSAANPNARELTGDAQRTLRERVDAVFEWAHLYGVRVDIKLRFPPGAK